ncbi:MAG: hypothetical protein ACD_73C00262G0006 [uncultured bacterium]|nr:MAG: hypothetical protein ACD_73C00262G0006 [uncultured bacterium]
MKKIIVVLFLVGVSLVCSHGAKAEEKIGLVSLQSALNQVEEGKRAMAGIQSEVTAKKNELDGLKANLKKMRDDVEKQKLVLSQDALQQKMGEIQTKFMELQQKAMQYDQELKKKESDSVQKILQKMKDVVVVVAKQGGYDIVYENSADTVIYSSKGVDITPDVIKAYNAGKTK